MGYDFLEFNLRKFQENSSEEVSSPSAYNIGKVVKNDLSQHMMQYPYKLTIPQKHLIQSSIIGLGNIEDWEIPRTLPPSIYADLYRFKKVLIFYRDRTPDKYYSVGEILHRCINEQSKFCAEVADTLKYAQRATFSIDWAREDYFEYPGLQGGIDYIFDPKCLLKFENEDEQDWKLLLEPAVIPDQEIVDSVINELRLFCQGKTFPRQDDLDLLKFLNGSKVYLPGQKATEINYLWHSRNNIKTTDKFSFKRAFVWKVPSESRDCLICDPPTLHTLKFAGLAISHICQNMKEYKLLEFDAYQALRKLPKDKLTYMMVDIKKCGLTFPRKLFIPVLEELYEMSGFDPFKQCADAYKRGPTILVEDTLYQTTEGLGLGQLNELVTLIMVLLYRSAKKLGKLPEDATGWFLNDDQVIFWDKSDDFSKDSNQMYLWSKYMRSSGIKVHDKKPFIANQGQFCEQWTRTNLNMEKRTRQIHILLSPLLAVNIAEAKAMFSYQYKRWWGLTDEDNEYALSSLIDFWGYEFSPKEVEYPVQLGGWVSILNGGVSPHLEYLLDPHCEPWAKKLWYYYKEPIMEFSPWKEKSLISSFKIKEEDNSIFSWNKRIQNLEECFHLKAHGQKFNDAYYIRKSLKKLLERKNSVKKNMPSKDQLILEMKLREHNNAAIPRELLGTGEVIEEVDITSLLDIQPNKNSERLWLSLFPELQIGSRGGTPACMWSNFLENKTAPPALWNNLWCKYIKSLPFLARFGSNTWNIFRNILHKIIDPHWWIDCEPPKSFLDLKKFSYGEGNILIPVAGFLVNTTLETMRAAAKIGGPDAYRKGYILHEALFSGCNDTFKENVSYTEIYQMMLDKAVDLEKSLIAKGTWYDFNRVLVIETVEKVKKTVPPDIVDFDVDYFKAQIAACLEQMDYSTRDYESRQELAPDYIAASLNYAVYGSDIEDEPDDGGDYSFSMFGDE